MLHTTTGYGYQLGSSNKTILVLRIKKESRDCTPLCTHHIFCRDVFRENWPPWKVATLSTPHPIDRNKKAPESISLFATQSCSSPCAQNGSNALCLLVETMICCRLPLNHLGQNIANLFDQHNKYHVSWEAPRGGPFWVLLWALGLRCYKKCAPKRSRRGSDGGDALASAVKSKMKFHPVKETWKFLTNTGECITKDHLGLVWGQYG